MPSADALRARRRRWTGGRPPHCAGTCWTRSARSSGGRQPLQGPRPGSLQPACREPRAVPRLRLIAGEQYVAFVPGPGPGVIWKATPASALDQSSRGLDVARRSTATSRRSISSSAFSDVGERLSRTSRPQNRTKIRKCRRSDTADPGSSLLDDIGAGRATAATAVGQARDGQGDLAGILFTAEDFGLVCRAGL